MISVAEAEKILGKRFIGPAQLASLSAKLPLALPATLPGIPWSAELLNKNTDLIVVWGVPAFTSGEKVTINALRDIFGTNPGASEPCFYNQDWYIKEPFAAEKTLEAQWYALRSSLTPESRGQELAQVLSGLTPGEQLPSAILTAFAFFTFHLLTGEALWPKEFVWCSDVDSNGDQIYTGRYYDPIGNNKNGFNIHRHLKIKPWYGSAPELLPEA